MSDISGALDQIRVHAPGTPDEARRAALTVADIGARTNAVDDVPTVLDALGLLGVEAVARGGDVQRVRVHVGARRRG